MSVASALAVRLNQEYLACEQYRYRKLQETIDGTGTLYCSAFVTVIMAATLQGWCCVRGRTRVKLTKETDYFWDLLHLVSISSTVTIDA